MANIAEKIEEFITDILSGSAQSSLIRAGKTIMDVADLMGDSVTVTPQNWNKTTEDTKTVFDTLRSISDTAVMPLAVSILAIIICYDLITAVMDTNNMKEFDLGIFLRFGIKGWVAIYFMNNAFTICEAFFEIGAWVAKTASDTLGKNSIEEIEILSSAEFKTMLSSLPIGDLGLACILSLLVYIISMAVMVIVMVVTAGRMIEILIYFSAAPIPFATMTNKEWNNVGYSFLKNILALALQAFFIVVVLSIYTTLFTTNVTNIDKIDGLESLSGILLQWICYSIICCFTLLKTGSISKSICGAH